MRGVIGDDLLDSDEYFARMVACRAGPGDEGQFPRDATAKAWHVANWGYLAGRFQTALEDGPEVVDYLLAEACDKGLRGEDMDLWRRAVAVGAGHPFSRAEVLRYQRLAPVDPGSALGPADDPPH